MADAEAICEAVLRPTMRFVETKTPKQQSVLMLHRIRLMLVNQRTMLQIRSVLIWRSLVWSLRSAGVASMTFWRSFRTSTTTVCRRWHGTA